MNRVPMPENKSKEVFGLKNALKIGLLVSSAFKTPF